MVNDHLSLTVLFVYRDEFYNRNSPLQGIAEIIVAKQRNGPTGVIKLSFQGEFTRFGNLTKAQE